MVDEVLVSEIEAPAVEAAPAAVFTPMAAAATAWSLPSETSSASASADPVVAPSHHAAGPADLAHAVTHVMPGRAESALAEPVASMNAVGSGHAGVQPASA